MRGLAPRQTPAGVNKTLNGKLHYHPCTDCPERRVFSCNCTTAAVNGRCQQCQGRARPSWDIARDPHDCCFNNCRQVTLADDLTRYQLAGPGPWFQCKRCCRSHGVYPQNKEME